MTTIAALMSFYADDADMIERAIRSVDGLATHLIAVDGAYDSFPGGEPHSAAETCQRVRETAEAIGVDLLFYSPAEVWARGEQEKRDRMYRMADATGADWYTVLDADFVFEYPLGIHAVFDALEDAHGFEVCDVDLRTPLKTEAGEWETTEQALPLFYRAAGLAPIRIGPTHYHTYREGSGTHLWGCGQTPQVPHFDMRAAVRVQHEWFRRDENRQASRWAYYMNRDGQQLEKNPFAKQLVAAMAEEE